jgi:predicted nucleic acid-binding protein
MPTAKCFADTNVAIYAVDADFVKREKALAVLAARPVISTQVVNEYLNVLLTKRKLGRADANELARALMATCDVAAVTPDITELAMNIGERYQVSHWDSLIVAAALATACDTLYSEDMQDGQVFEGRLTVKNPFPVQP